MSPKDLKARYEKGENISAILRQESQLTRNNERIIEVSYDLQAGSYVAALKQDEFREHLAQYSLEIASVIEGLGLSNGMSVLEAGIGEATTFSEVRRGLSRYSIRSFGFDLSWSRIAVAKTWLAERKIHDTVLCTGSLLGIPFLENSIDVVYTSHSIEPNGGMEEEILKELYRVTRKYLVLLEPAYELASAAGKLRMDSHGYIKDLVETAKRLDFEVIEHRPFRSLNPLNPTGLTVIRKRAVDASIPAAPFACPAYKTPLEALGGGGLFSPEAMVVYPIIAGIPCLRVENGIVASCFPDILGQLGY